MFKIARYSRALRILGSVLKAKKEELIIAVFIIIVSLILASSLMYFVESKAQPASFSNIPQAMWWGIATLTTVGYGDVYPVTYIGKFLGAIVSLLGIGMFALPTGIISSGFAEEIRGREGAVKICPYCGKAIQT
jgi:voltage-gated potassium channel